MLDVVYGSTDVHPKGKNRPFYKSLFSYFIHCSCVVCFWFSNNLCVFLSQSTAACGVEAHSDAIQPSHIREAIRRYGHKIGPLSPFTVRNNRVIKSYIYNLKEFWFSSGQMKQQWNCWKQFVVAVILLYKSGIILLGNELVIFVSFWKNSFFLYKILFSFNYKLCFFFSLGAYIFYFSKLRFIKFFCQIICIQILLEALYILKLVRLAIPLLSDVLLLNILWVGRRRNDFTTGFEVGWKADSLPHLQMVLKLIIKVCFFF